MGKKSVVQQYPRITDEKDKFNGFFDDSRVTMHSKKIPIGDLKTIIQEAIRYAAGKSSRVILEIPDTCDLSEMKKIYMREGRELFDYFVKYCGDPASTAHACLNRHFIDVGKEQFRNRTLQKQRMNSGWRYQYIAKRAAEESKRFLSISDIGSSEADFNATIKIIESKDPLNIYISVKNRTNTMGGQDWPKAIVALEEVAKNDKNRTGPYICVFGIAMEKGLRNIKHEKKTQVAYSSNTEIWMSDYFWPFFSNRSYEEIIRAVLDVLIDTGQKDDFEVDVPDELLESFGDSCRKAGLLDTKGFFNDPYRIASLFCGRKPKFVKGGS